MAGNTIENSGVHYGSHLRMDSERNFNMELAKREMASAIGIKGDPTTLYPLLSDYEMNEEIDKATKPPCRLTGNVRERLYPGYKDNPFSPEEDKEKEGGGGGPSQKNGDGGLDVDGVNEKPRVIPAPGEEELAKKILLQNPQCLFEYNRILEVLQKQRLARQALMNVEEIARNALADVWCLHWEELYELSSESMQRAASMTRERVAREYRLQRVAQRRRELEELQDREIENVFHTEEMLAELDGMRGDVAVWKEQLASFYYNNSLYLE